MEEVEAEGDGCGGDTQSPTGAGCKESLSAKYLGDCEWKLPQRK